MQTDIITSKLVLGMRNMEHRIFSTPAARRQKEPRLLSLPVEILLLISTFLPPENEAMLAFACKDLCNVVGTLSWTKAKGPYTTKPNPAEVQRIKEAMLSLLAKDMDPATTVVCFAHGIIHKASLQTTPSPSTSEWMKTLLGVQIARRAKPLLCKSAFTLDIADFRIRCWEVQLALGGTIPIKRLVAYERPKARIPYHVAGALSSTKVAQDMTMYSRIVNGRFMVAMQLRVAIPTTFKPGSGDSKLVPISLRCLEWRRPFQRHRIQLNVPPYVEIFSGQTMRVGQIMEPGSSTIQYLTAGFDVVNDNQVVVSLDMFIDLGNGHVGRDILWDNNKRETVELWVVGKKPEVCEQVGGSEEMVERWFGDHEERLRALRPVGELWEM